MKMSLNNFMQLYSMKEGDVTLDSDGGKPYLTFPLEHCNTLSTLLCVPVSVSHITKPPITHSVPSVHRLSHPINISSFYCLCLVNIRDARLT